ncbi:MAG: protein-methionine-sulfoxide reductase heme-binding subunit MsrQ [Rubellimicrobium sp.]|nr:protein-methionine-sulfoxide reductase heme-binding subunit MsrQ [Rubellimicrobium sp.]
MVVRINGGLRQVPPGVIYALGVGWAGWLFWRGLTGDLGVEPINALERAYGDIAIKLMIATLAVTPLRHWTGLNLLRFRRALGLACFGFVLAHLAVWALLDVQVVSALWDDVVKRPYVTVGMLSFLLLVPLAVTSNDLSVRRMGAASWRGLHRLTYPAAVLAALHYLWIAKGFDISAILHAVVIVALLALRLRGRTRVQMAR